MFEKEDLSTRHIVKLRGGAMCFIGEFNGGFRLHSKNYLGESTGVADLKEYKEDLKVKSNNEEYDIFAIKEFRSTSKAIGAIFNEEDIKWDWERDEKSPKQLKIKELQKSAKDLMDKAEDINKQISELNSEE